MRTAEINNGILKETKSNIGAEALHSSNSKIKFFYNRFIFLYPLVDVFLSPQKRKLVKTINQLPAGNVLEIGIGTGSHIAHYKKHSVTGIDVSDRSIEKAKCRKANTETKLLVMDGELLLFTDSTFDVVVICHVIAVTNDPEKMLRESLRVLKNGGMLFILNHETPDNFLKYMDKFFSLFSRLLRFSSVFKLNQLKELRSFEVFREEKTGFADYFKLLTLKKSA
ncbi:MAG: class I SAM-dependent methyltransferase [Bacteroidia bacterium]|nr:class I SAM-dependent methyltransferase [Bacteroidia bacterium]